jgi:hypothetical protein
MPYLTEERKRFLDLNPDKAYEVGDCNYLFTLGLIHEWNKEPRYKTIHRLKKACYSDSTASTAVFAIEARLRGTNVDKLDIETAKQLAFDEFYRRIGSKYEDKKIEENGDVY